MVNETEKCEVCGKTSRDAKVIDAVLDKDILKLCEMCARVEGAVIMPKPSTEQLIEADRPHTVYERLVRASGVNLESSNIVKAKNADEINLSSLQDEWIKRKEAEKTEEKMQGKTEGKVPEIQEIQETSRKKFDIDFRSKSLKIADLHSIRNKFFAGRHTEMKKEQEKRIEETEGAEEGIDIDNLNQ